jgi:anti-sigma regulatory factor (Ser/Thr protein kinase)
VTDAASTPPLSVAPATIGPVRLEVPALSGMSRIARITGTGVAAMAGFTMDEIDDINVMVSEVMVALVEHGAQSDIEVTFDVADGRFTVRGSADIVGFDLDDPDLALCRTVLAAVSTTHGIEGTSTRADIWASLQQHQP